MKNLAFVLLLAISPNFFSKSPNDKDTNVYVIRASRLFSSKVSGLNQIDFANMRAFVVSSDAGISEWQQLRHGRGMTKELAPAGSFAGSTEVRLAWQKQLDASHAVVAYDWEWVGGSSSHSQLVQVFELRDDKIFITQQIEADTHHGDTAVGAVLNPSKKTLIVRSVELDSPKGRCCPTQINVVAFAWTGKQFRRVSAFRVPSSVC
jgi:hypothetical protein